MNRVDYLRSFGDITTVSYPSHKIAVFRALTACLTAEESCALFDTDFRMEANKQNIVGYKISDDAKNEVCPCHTALIGALLSKYHTYGGNIRQRAGVMLASLYSYGTDEQKNRILLTLLHSHLRSDRRRAYEILNRTRNHEYMIPIDEYSAEVEEAWVKHRDIQCAALIGIRFSDEFVLDKLEELTDCLLPKYKMLTEFYLRVGKLNSNSLRVLAAANPLTYLYVCACLKHPVAEEEAMSIFQRYESEREFSYELDKTRLFLWCFGQLGMWKGILTVQAHTANEG